MTYAENTTNIEEYESNLEKRQNQYAHMPYTHAIALMVPTDFGLKDGMPGPGLLGYFQKKYELKESLVRKMINQKSCLPIGSFQQTIHSKNSVIISMLTKNRDRQKVNLTAFKHALESMRDKLLMDDIQSIDFLFEIEKYDKKEIRLLIWQTFEKTNLSIRVINIKMEEKA